VCLTNYIPGYPYTAVEENFNCSHSIECRLDSICGITTEACGIFRELVETVEGLKVD